MAEPECRGTADELEGRRREVLRLRFARMTQSEIASRLGVSAATVSRDLEAIHGGWGERFGAAFDMVKELAEAVELYDALERSAMKELLRLEDSGQGSTAAKIKCVWAVRAMRESRLDLLAGVGLMKSSMPAKNYIPRAEEIRRILQAARSDGRELVSEAEREWRPLARTP